MQWFKHDSNANMDAKLQEILLDYGLEGYGLYWYCIELITDKISKDNITFQLEHDARIIARNTGSTVQKVEEMMRRLVELGLFEASNGTISCLKVAKRLDKSMTSSPKMRELIEQVKGNHPDKVKIHHDAISKPSDVVMQEENRREENKKEENRLDESKKNSSTNLDYSLWPEIPEDELLKEWKKSRLKLKANLTQRVIDSFGKELTIAKSKGFSVEYCLGVVIDNGWKGLKSEWIFNHSKSNSNGNANTIEDFKQDAINTAQRIKDTGILNDLFDEDGNPL